jgi:hypothetical protein
MWIKNKFEIATSLFGKDCAILIERVLFYYQVRQLRPINDVIDGIGGFYECFLRKMGITLRRGNLRMT